MLAALCGREIRNFPLRDRAVSGAPAGRLTVNVKPMAVQLHLAQRRPGTLERGPLHDTIRVVLVDDHLRARRGLRLLLDRDAAIDVVPDGAEVLGVTRNGVRARPDVMVLDLQLTGGASIATIRQLRDQLPGTEIVVLTLERNPVFARRALEAGATGYVLKSGAEAELAEAVRCAADGIRYVSPHVAAGLEALRGGDGPDPLSARETEVLRLIALGHTSAEIAQQLHVSRRTVDSHRASIHRKLGLRTRADLVQFALARGLLGH